MSMNIERAGQHMRCEAFVPGGMMGKGGEELHGDGKADVGSPEQSAAPDVVGNVGGQQGNGFGEEAVEPLSRVVLCDLEFFHGGYPALSELVFGYFSTREREL